jgi:MEDS: MEthanogen/methylotroph, DcmR Sensory domain
LGLFFVPNPWWIVAQNERIILNKCTFRICMGELQLSNENVLIVTGDSSWTNMTEKEHLVHFYATDKFLTDVLADYVSKGFDNKETVIIIATEEHLVMLNRELENRNYDLLSIARRDMYITLDASDLLNEFMVDGWPVKALFEEAIGPVLRKAGKSNRKIRAFGEMVMLLWKGGFHGATIHLEHLWNELAEEHEFALLCAYPSRAFSHGLESAIQHVCKAHSKVIISPDSLRSIGENQVSV